MKVEGPKVVALISSAAIQHETMSSMTALAGVGWDVRVTMRVADICLARNLALSEALLSKPRVILSLDDDIAIDPEDAERLAAVALELQEPVSAMYMLSPERWAFGTWDDENRRPRRYFAGLGCLAIPRGCLEAVADASKLCEHAGRTFYALTYSNPYPVPRPNGTGEPVHNWHSEEMTLCNRLGGVRIAPIAARHSRLAMLAPRIEHAPDLPGIIAPSDDDRRKVE